MVAEAPPAPAPKPTQLAGSDAGVEQDASGERKPTSDPALACSAQNALAGVTMPAGQVPTTATDVPRMDMSGEADPGQLQSALDTSGQQTREAAIETAQATHNDFGENDIYPEADGEILEATQGLGEASRGSLAPSAETAPAALPAEALASIDAEVSPILHEKIGAEQQTYVQGKAGHDAEAQAAHEQARQDITSLEESTTASQTEAQTLARSDVSAARQEWQTGIDRIQTDFQTQAGAARSEHVAQIQTRHQAGNQEAAGHIAEAENKAELEKQKAERKTEEKQNAAKQESKGFWGWAKSKAKALVDGLKQAVNFIYDNLRKAVKALFEAAKKLALAAIELARRAIVGLIQAYGAILKGLVSVALAAFPELRDRMLARIDQAVTRATEIVNQAADALKKGVTAILDFLASTIDSILGLIQDLYNAALTVIGMLVSGELAELMKRLGDLVAAARTAPGQFETAAYEELLGGNLDQPLSPAELMAAGRTPPGGAGPGAGGEMGAAEDGQLPGPPWSEANVGVETMASGVELDTELGDEILQMTGGGDGEVVFGESQDPSRNMDAILGLQGQGQTHGRAPGQHAAYTDGLTPRERAAVKWDMMKKGLAEWWSKNWPYVLAGGVLAVAGFIVANILTGGAILAALPAIMSAVGYIFAGVTAVQLAGHLRDFLQKGWNGDIQGGGKSLAKGLAAGAVELLTWLTFKVGSVAMRGAKAAARGVARGAQAAARGAAKVARRGASYVLQGGKVLLRGVSQGIARGVKRLRDLGARLLQRTRFKGFRIRVHGRRFTLEGKINPWVLLAGGRIVEVDAKSLPDNAKVGDKVEVLLDKRRAGLVVSSVDEPPTIKAIQDSLESNPNFLKNKPLSLFPVSVKQQLQRTQDIEATIARLEAKKASKTLSVQEQQELHKAKLALEPRTVDDLDEFLAVRSDATRLVPAGTKVPVDEMPQLHYAQSLMNELNKASAKLGDGSVAFSIIAEQVHGGKYAVAVIGDTLHAVKGIDYADKLRTLAMRNVKLPQAAKARLLEEVRKLEEALEWARNHGRRAQSGNTALGDLPAWARQHGDELEKLLRQQSKSTPSADDLRRHREWNE